MRPNVSVSRDLDDVVVTGFVAAVVVAPIAYCVGLAIWLAGQLSAVLTGHPWPDVPPGAGFRILVALIGDPGDVSGAWPEAVRAGLGPDRLIVVLSVLFNVPVIALIVLVGRLVIDLRRRRVWRRFRLGFASRSEVVELLGTRALVAKARHLRPSLRGSGRVRPADVGFYLGRDSRSGRKLWASVEDGMVVVGAPRQGKDAHFCTANIIDAPGPVIVTASRSDIFTTTYEARSRVGKIYVFDPKNWTLWPEVLRFSPVRSCDNVDDAKKFADYMMGTTGLTAEGHDGHAVLEAKSTLRHLLFAAAVADRTIRDVSRWAGDPDNREPVDILRRYEAVGVAAPGSAAAVERTAAVDSDHRTKVYYFISRALGMFAAPAIMDACSAQAADAFDMTEFMAGRNTLYLLAREGPGSHLGALVGLILGDLVGRARTAAIRSPDGRLDPPLTLELNDVVSVASLTGTPSMMVDLSALSIAVHVYLQDLASARDAWGAAGASALWSNATVRVVLGGGGHSDDLNELSRLMGRTDDRRGTVVRDVMSPEEIRTMKFGRAVVLARSARAVEVELTPWWKRHDGREIRRAKRRTEEQIRRNISSAAAKTRARLNLAASADKTESG
ncbi:type IV secretory system conjugative DNA transfer family protein [Virgisporangium aurantiacum]|uniref:Type IV secretory pathway, VirD4 component, TraG/TraD family ATPase n=1 Tax=Virgisporangium aurantiacum TaxID=175570 RepID=A0A8J3Z7I4_9ACTN|nr:type IV secretory system conjugative DNA transfer family protein [Virgisporangium aurantiacum]GIJ58909.1 hypothetical protein Vau01_064250 [Virgisporangium aurantiacum]